MTFSENLMALRKKHGLSQEGLGALVGVSRQTVSKWELGSTTPELDKLVALSEYFDVSLDELVGRKTRVSEDRTEFHETSSGFRRQYYEAWHYEYRSKREFHGLPLVHINVCDRGLCRAKGIIAIGNIATGVVAIGAVAAGVVSIGAVTVGLLALGAMAVGILALGAIGLGLFAFGGLVLGYLSMGGCAIGTYAVGGSAVASRVAVGEAIRAPIAIQTDTVQELVFGLGTQEQIHVLMEQILTQFSSTPRWIARLLSFVALRLMAHV